MGLVNLVRVMSISTGGNASKAVAIEPRRRVARQGLSLSYRAITPLVMAADAALILATCLLSIVIYDYYFSRVTSDILPYLSVAILTAALFILAARNQGTYELNELLNFKEQLRKLAANWSAVFLLLTGLAFSIKLGESFSRITVALFWCSGFVALALSRMGWRLFLASEASIRAFSYRQIAVISDSESTSDGSILDVINRHGSRASYHFVLPKDWSRAETIESTIREAIDAIRGSDVEEVVICANAGHWEHLATLMQQFRILPLPVTLLPTGPLADLLQNRRQTIGDTVTIELQSAPHTFFSRAVKRLIDILFSTLGLILLAPLFLMTAAAIKIDSTGPIMFRQRRCGFNGQIFNILKFRTMYVLEDGETVIQAQKNDRRITRIGAWLRRTSIDELPQLFNVLKGEMSIVGPRPHALAHDDQFEKVVSNYAYRHHVKPGITGWAQVNGFRGETRTWEDLDQRIKLDLYYINNGGLALDIRIILMTVVEVLRGRNAY